VDTEALSRGSTASGLAPGSSKAVHLVKTAFTTSFPVPECFVMCLLGICF